MRFLESEPQITAYAPIDIKNADIYLRDGYDNGSSSPTTTFIEPEGESTILLTGMATVVPDPAVTTGVSVKFGSDDTEYTVTSRTGGAGTNEVQTIHIDDDVDGGNFTLTYSGQTTGNIAWNAAANVVEAAFEALSTVGLGNGTVTGASPTWTVTFTGDLAATAVSAITGSDVSLASGDATDVEITNTVAGVAAVAEQQDGLVSGTWTSGTFTLAFDGETTGPIDFDAAVEEIEMALESLDGIAVGEATVAEVVAMGTDAGNFHITFSGALAGDQPQVTSDVGSIVGAGATLTMSTDTPGVTGVQDVQTLAVNPTVTGGTFALTHAAVETAPLAWDCTAAEVQAALILAPTSETVTCTGGPFPVSPIVVTWTATGTNTAITGTSENLTGGSGTAVTVVETTPGVSATSTASIVITPVLAAATTAGGSVTFGGRRLSVKVGEGTVNYDETVNREYILNRNNLDTVRDGPDVPMDVSFDFVWEFITANPGAAIPTIEDVLKQIGEADTWLTTSADACEPYCIDIEIYYDPGCGGANTELISLPFFRHEKLSHNLGDSQISCTGKCNVTVANATRGS